MKKLFAIIVLAGFLVSCTRQDVKPHDTPARETMLKGFVRHDGIELRSEQGTHGQVLETLKPSDDLEVLAPSSIPEKLDQSEWYRVRFNGKSGWIQGSNLSNYAEGVAPELDLFQDGSFRLTINRCEGMTPVKGEYLITEEHIVLHGMTAVHQPVSRYWSTILDQMVVELARLESGDLLIENKLSYFDGFQSYGSCAPNKGETFVRGE